jgi:Rab GDP dissociation inhibitor
MYVAIISTMVETNNPEKEILPALDLIESVLERFVTISDLYVPVDDYKDGLWISNSMDSTSHFEN